MSQFQVLLMTGTSHKNIAKALRISQSAESRLVRKAMDEYGVNDRYALEHALKHRMKFNAEVGSFVQGWRKSHA